MAIETAIKSDKVDATLISVGGIGPEIIDTAVAGLDALGAPFVWDVPCSLCLIPGNPT